MESQGHEALATKLSKNYSLVSLNMQETKLNNIGALASALTLSGLSGSLKYLNLTNNKQTVEMLTEACGPLSKLIQICKGLKVLRMNKIREVDWLV